MNKDNWKLRVC